MTNFEFQHTRKLLIIGIAFLVAGSILLSFTSFVPSTAYMYSVNRVAFDMNTYTSYLSESFRAESGDFLGLYIITTETSTIVVKGQVMGEIFKVDGKAYDYHVKITDADVYQVQVVNKAGFWSWFSWVQVENHIYGSFEVKRTPAYSSQLSTLGTAFLGISLILLPTTIYAEYYARRRKKQLYKCPRCRNEVKMGLNVCPHCRLDLTKYWVTCKYCGKFYDSHAGKCPKCGAEPQT